MVERFLRYSLEHGRKITLMVADERGIRRMNVTVTAMDESTVTYTAGRAGKSKTLARDSILSAAYARGDEGDTLKKSLVGLTVIDSFFDAVIVMDDVVVESTTQDCDDIAMAAARMYGAAASYLSELSAGKCSALVVDTDNQMLAIYPLKDESVIVCILDKGAAESVWRRDIPGKLERVQEALEL